MHCTACVEDLKHFRSAHINEEHVSGEGNALEHRYFTGLGTLPLARMKVYEISGEPQQNNCTGPQSCSSCLVHVLF